MNYIDILFMLGGALAAGVVSAMCGMGLVVWLSGNKLPPPKP